MKDHMSKTETIVYILSSIHHVLRAEKLLLRTDLIFDLIPVPKEVNPDCGMAVETAAQNAVAVTDILTKAGLTIEAVYRRNGRDFMEISPIDLVQPTAAKAMSH